MEGEEREEGCERDGRGEIILEDKARGRESQTWIHNAKDKLTNSCVILQINIHSSIWVNGFFRAKFMVFFIGMSFPRPWDRYILLINYIVPQKSSIIS